MKRSVTAGKDVRLAKRLWGELSRPAITTLKQMIETHSFSLPVGDLLYLGGSWYVTHTGLLGLARRNRCAGIHVRLAAAFCDPTTSRWTFEATVYKSQGCRGFVGYGDADPSNVSPLVHGAELRIAETRAVNRALRKAYGIGICSVEELASSAAGPRGSAPEAKKLPPQQANGNYGGPKVRDRLWNRSRISSRT